MELDLAKQLEMTITDNGVCEKKITFSVNAEGIDSICKSVVADLANSVNIPGFRRGKAPAGMLMKRFEKEINDEIRRYAYQAAFQRLDSEKLDIVTWGRPEDGEFDRAKGLDFSLTVGIAPEFEIGTYTGIQVNVPAAKADDKVVDERLAQYRKMYAEFVDADTPAQAEDMLKVAYESDFELAEDAAPALVRMVKSDNNYIWLAEPESIPGSIAAMTGVNAGEKREFTAVFPEDFRIAELAGKSVKYNVTVNAIQRRKELDDAALAAKLNIESIDLLRADIAKMVQDEADNKRKGEIREAIYAKLDEQVAQFEFPASLVEGETNNELRMIAERIVKDEAGAEKFKEEMDTHKAEAEKAALKSLRRMFILRKIAEKEELTVDEKLVEARIEAMAAYYGKKAKELRQLMERNGAIDSMRLDMLNEKVMDFLAEKAEISE